MEVGAQLFTIRDFCKTTEDFAESLKKIADIGYRNVQVSGTCDFEPEWLKNELMKNGLKCVLTHVPGPKLTETTQKVAKDHDIFGCDHIGLGWYGFKEDDPDNTYDHFFETYLPVCETLHKNGKHFMYHNHDQEFQKRDGKVILEHLAEKMPSELMGFVLDIFWVQAGGGDPAWWLERLAGRVSCIHLKDFAYGKKMAVLGEGNINMDRVFQAAEMAGTQYMLVEQDDCYGENPFDCLKRSYEYLKARGLR